MNRRILPTNYSSSQCLAIQQDGKMRYASRCVADSCLHIMCHCCMFGTWLQLQLNCAATIQLCIRDPINELMTKNCDIITSEFFCPASSQQNACYQLNHNLAFLTIYACPYMLQINFQHFILQGLSIIIVAYQVELFFAGGFPTSMEDEPIRVCEYYDFDDDYYGYRACSNMIAAGVVNILVCIILLIIDLFNPCLNSGVSKSCLAYSSSLSQ